MNVWNATTGAVARTIDPGKVTTGASLAPDGHSVAVCLTDGTVAVYDVFTGQPRWTAAGQTKQVQALAFSPDGKTLISGHADGTVAVWNAGTGGLTRAVSIPDHALEALAIAPDGKTLATSQSLRTYTMTMEENGEPRSDVRLWDTATWQTRQTIKCNDIRSTYHALAWSPDSTLLVGVHELGGSMTLRGAAPSGSSVSVWKSATGDETEGPAEGFAGPRSVTFSRDAKWFAIGDGNGHWVYHLPGWKPQGRDFRNSGTVTALLFSADDKTLFTGNNYGGVTLWSTAETDAERGNPRPAKARHENGVLCLALSPDGTLLASGGMDNVVNLSAATGDLIASLDGHSGPVTSVMFSPDGTTLASGSRDGSIKLWSVGAHSLRATLTLLPGAASPNWIASTSEGYYTASHGAGAYLDWYINGHPMPAANRRALLNRPERVQQAIQKSP